MLELWWKVVWESVVLAILHASARHAHIHAHTTHAMILHSTLLKHLRTLGLSVYFYFGHKFGYAFSYFG